MGRMKTGNEKMMRKMNNDAARRAFYADQKKKTEELAEHFELRRFVREWLEFEDANIAKDGPYTAGGPLEGFIERARKLLK